MRRVPVVTGFAVIAIGVVVVLGWVIGSEALTRVAPGLVGMKANTAIGLIASGLALVALRPGAAARSCAVGRRLGLGVAALGAVVIAEYLFGGIGIDGLLSAGDTDANPGRPSPHTAIAFVVYGVAVATIDRSGPLRALNSAAIVFFGGIVLFAAVGYVYGVDYLHSISGTVGVALHTLASLILLCAGLLALRPRQGPLAFLYGDDAGARMARVLLPVALVVPLVAGMLRYASQRTEVVGLGVGTAVYTLVSVVGLTALVAFTARRLRRVDADMRRLAAIVASSDDAILSTDRERRITSWNAGAERLFGIGAEEAIGRPVSDLVPADRLEEFEARSAAIDAGLPVARWETERQRLDGTRIDVSLTVSPLLDAGGEVIGAAAIMRDISRRREAEKALAESEERFRRSFEDSGVGMGLIEIRDGEPGGVFESNRALRDLVGYTAEQLPTVMPSQIISPKDIEVAYDDLKRVIRGEVRSVARELRLVVAGGEEVWVAATASVVRDAEGEPIHLMVQAQDISERKHFEGQLQYLADHDALTGLFNRRRIEEELDRETAAAARFGSRGAVLVLDVDHFKVVNDTLGHGAGDELISGIGRILRERLRRTDVLGRIGGDEFVAILPRAGATEARKVGEDLLDAVRGDDRVLGAAGGRRLTASAGVATYGKGPGRVPAQDVLAAADIAMYDAKEAGRDRVFVFDPLSPRHERTRRRLDWIERIEAALDGRGFVMHAQPIVPLGAAGRHRYELLLRMAGDDGELILPGEFLDTAERSDLVQRIDRWVICEAVGRLAIQERLGRDVCFEVNLSGRSIGDARVADYIDQCLVRSGVDPSRLVFEVTETAAIVNVGTAKEFAQRMHELGCGFALDDFGAGFASFYYLKHLSFDLLKIDGEFIRNLPTSPVDQLVVRSVVDIARGLEKRTVAESVGDQATVDLLRGLGVDFAQGFFLGEPRPLAALEDGAPGSAPLTA